MSRASIEKSVQRVLQRRRERELKIEKDAVKYARAHGWLSRKMNGLGYRDWPDRLFVPQKNSGRKGNWSFWVEFKKKGEDLRIGQKNLIEDLINRGQIVRVIDDFDYFVEVFRRINDIIVRGY